MILALIGTTMLPWKLLQKIQKSQNVPNLMKLHSNDEQHWKMWNLALEFPKYLLLPWKQCKKVKTLNFHRTFQNINVKFVLETLDDILVCLHVMTILGNSKMAAIAMETGQKFNIDPTGKHS